MALFKINVQGLSKISPIVLGKIIIQIEYDNNYIFSIEDFTTNTVPEYQHPNNANAAIIKIINLGISEGDLEFNGQPVEEGQEINVEDIELLSYKSNINNTNSYSEEFTFNIADEESLEYNENLLGGVSLQISAQRNRPPIVGDVEIETDYLQSIVLTKQMFIDSNPEYFDPEGDLPALLRIVQLPSNGILRLGSIAVEELDIIDFEDIKDGKLTFTPFSNNGQEFIDNFEFEIADAGSGQFSG